MDEGAARRAGISVFFLLVPPVGELLCKEQKRMNSWHKNAGWFPGMSLRCQKSQTLRIPPPMNQSPFHTKPGHVVKLAPTVLDQCPN